MLMRLPKHDEYQAVLCHTHATCNTTTERRPFGSCMIMRSLPYACILILPA